MRWPRFTLLQLLLFTALIALLAGWLRQAWETRSHAQLSSVEISPDGKLLAAMYWSRSPQLWDLSAPEPRRVTNFNLTNDSLPDFSLVPALRFLDGGSLVVQRHTRRGSELVRFDPATGKEQALLRGASAFASWAVSQDGETAVTFDGAATPAGSTLDVWELKRGKRLHQLNVPAVQSLYRVEVDAHGTTIAASDYVGAKIEVLDVRTGKSRKIAGGSFGEPWALATNGRTLVVADWMRPGGQIASHCDVFLYDLSDPHSEPRRFDSENFATKLWISSDGSRLLLSNFAGGEVWDTRSAKRLWKQNDFSLTAPVFGPFPMMDGWKLSADGRRVAAISKHGEIYVLDAATGQRMMTIGGTHPLRHSILYGTAFLGWAVAWGLASRRERLRQPAIAPMQSFPAGHFRLTQWQAANLAVGVLAGMCGLFAWLVHGLIGYWLGIAPGAATFLTTFSTLFFGLFACLYLKLRLWPLAASQKLAQSIVGNTGRPQRHGKITGLFAGASTIEHTFHNHIEDIRRKLADLLGRDVHVEQPLLVIGLERADDFHLLNRSRIPHGGIVLTHLSADECRVCEELARRDGTTAAAMLRATIALALLRRHWRVDAPLWLTSVMSAWLSADEQGPAALQRANRMLAGILGDESEGACREFLRMTAAERYQQVVQKEDPTVLRQLLLGQAMGVSLAEFTLAEYDGGPRERLLQVIRSVGKRGNIDEAMQRVFGHSAEELAEPWWKWFQQQPRSRWEPPPAEARRAIAQLAGAICPGSRLPTGEQQRNLAVLGSTGDLAVVPALLAILEDAQHPRRAEALWALRGISGLHGEDDPPRWRAWWKEVEPQATASGDDRPSIAAQWSAGASDAIVTAELATAVQAAESPAAQQPHEPWQLVAARAFMGVGGVWGILFAVASSFYLNAYATAPLLLPLGGIALGIGLLAVARAAGRHWWGLRLAAGLQTAAILGCDPLQSGAGFVAARLLGSQDVRRYLQRVGGG